MIMLRKCKFLICVTSVTILFWLPTISAQQETKNELAEAQQWLTVGEYQKAYEAFTFHAQEKQNPLAQYSLALFYQKGWHVKADAVVACQWYEKAANGGIPEAAHFFGQCLQDGIHQVKDYQAAMHWYQQAVQLGHVISSCSIAELYMQGHGVEKDPQKALADCEQVASAGSVPAQLKMGRFYLEGAKEIRNIQYAAAWFGYAAEGGSLEAIYQLGTINLKALYDPVRALYWFEMAANRGYLPAYYQTALLYFHAPLSEKTGMPTTENLAKSYLWLSVTQQQSTNKGEQRDAEWKLIEVERVMPESWKADLDQQVLQHIAEFH